MIAKVNLSIKNIISNINVINIMKKPQLDPIFPVRAIGFGSKR
jgi:hypothetical protein